MKEESLIFIVSQPRSGSTFLQNLISNNEETNTCSEPWILLNFSNLINPNLIRAADYDNSLANRAFENYKRRFSDFNVNEKQKKFLLELYTPLKNNFNYVVDKTPRYWEILEEIHSLFPKSKIILLKRNPIEVAKSMIVTWGLDSVTALAKYKRDLLIAPNRILSFQKKFGDDYNIYSLSYESLVQNPLEEVKKIYDWIGIPFNESVLEISKNKKYKGEFGDPYQNSEKDYWEVKTESKKKKFSDLQISFIEGYAEYLGESFLLDLGGYKIVDIKPRKTLVFSYFLHHKREGGKSSLKKELIYFLKEILFRLRVNLL